MPTIRKIKNEDGTTSYCAQVRIRPFKPTSKTLADKAAVLDWAKKLEKELREQKRKKNVRLDLAKLTIRDLNLEYLEDPETKRLSTYDDKHRLLSWWVQEYGATKVLEFSVADARDARAKLMPGREPGTVNRYLSEQRSAWNWGRATGLVPKNEVWPERLMLTEPQGRIRYANDGELAAVDKAAREDSLVMWAAIKVSAACGLRQSELLRLNDADLDLTGQHSPNGPRLIVRKSKNEDMRAVYIPPAACEALRELLNRKVRPIDGAVFALEDGTRLKKGVLNVRWRRIREAAGLVDFHWHDWRHTCASLLAQGGATLLEIGATLGHRSPAATARYAHLVQGAATRGHANLERRLSGTNIGTRQ
jgi:integrase